MRNQAKNPARMLGGTRAEARNPMTDTGTKPSLPDILLSFLRLGASAFGGPSMVAYIGKMAVEKKRWLGRESFLNGAALCQVIPGATAMQAAAYVGLKTRGVSGAAVSFIGFGLPAFLLMMALSVLYARAHSLPVVVSVFGGLQAIIVAMVANAVVLFGRNALKDWRGDEDCDLPPHHLRQNCAEQIGNARQAERPEP
jgi:chromate transport protein ChrA